MKKLLFLVTFAFCVVIVYAQEQHPENCPFGGQKDCTGQCGLFTDENGDGFCDFAILSKQKKETKQQDVQANNPNDNKKETKQVNNAVEKVNQSKKIENNVKNDVSEAISGATQPTESTTEVTEVSLQTESDTQQETQPKNKFPYHLWQVLIATLIAYCCTALLAKAKKIKKVTHRKIWNVILGVTCLVSCLLGVYVVLAKMYSLPMNYLTLMQLHVDFGISMTVIAIIHILWHLNYWKHLFKSAGKKA